MAWGSRVLCSGDSGHFQGVTSGNSTAQGKAPLKLDARGSNKLALRPTNVRLKPLALALAMLLAAHHLALPSLSTRQAASCMKPGSLSLSLAGRTGHTCLHLAVIDFGVHSYQYVKVGVSFPPAQGECPQRPLPCLTQLWWR